jgi:hypothetical protein
MEVVVPYKRRLNGFVLGKQVFDDLEIAFCGIQPFRF